METNEIKPHRITKPIQLLSAWLVGLILINGSFLTTAVTLNSSGWLQPLLIIAAVLNVPIFIFAIFLLQTRFRPEMQEDLFYAQYLDKKTNTVLERSRVEVTNVKLRKAEIKPALISEDKAKKSESTRSKDVAKISITMNDHLPKFIEFRRFLKTQGYKANDIFGKVNDSKPPKKLVMAINEFIDLELVKPIIKQCREYGIEYLSKFDPQEEPDQFDVYIGSYDFKNIFPITDDIIKHIDEYDWIDIEMSS